MPMSGPRSHDRWIARSRRASSRRGSDQPGNRPSTDRSPPPPRGTLTRSSRCSTRSRRPRWSSGAKPTLGSRPQSAQSSRSEFPAPASRCFAKPATSCKRTSPTSSRAWSADTWTPDTRSPTTLAGGCHGPGSDPCPVTCRSSSTRGRATTRAAAAWPRVRRRPDDERGGPSPATSFARHSRRKRDTHQLPVRPVAGRRRRCRSIYRGSATRPRPGPG